MTTKDTEIIDKFLKRVFSNPTLSAIKYYLKQRLTDAENSPKLAKRSIMTEYTDDRWITREVTDPENAIPVKVTDQLGNKVGNGFVSPETGKICIDLHVKNGVRICRKAEKE